MKSAEEMASLMRESIILDRLESHLNDGGWCLAELGQVAGHNRRWIQRKLRGDTQFTLSEFLLILAIVDMPFSDAVVNI